MIKGVLLLFVDARHCCSASVIKGYCTSEAPEAIAQKKCWLHMNSLFVFPKVMWHPVQTDWKRAEDTARCVWEIALQQAGETFSIGPDLVTQESTVLPNSRVRFLAWSSAHIDYIAQK